MELISLFRLVGLSKPHTFLLELMHSDKETVRTSKSNMSQNEFDDLYKQCKGAWGM